MSDRIPGAGGGMTTWFELWRATIDNELVENITWALDGGNVDMNRDRTVTTQATFNLRDAAIVSPYTDFLAVFQNTSYDDGRDPDRDQLGLFTIRIPTGTRTPKQADAVYTGYDITSMLSRRTFDDVHNISAGTNYTDAVTSIMAAAGITRHAIPPTTQTLANALTFPPGTMYLDACNQLRESIGFSNLVATPDGRPLSLPSMDVAYIEPFRTVINTDIMAPIQTQPTDTTVANIVTVIQDNPNDVSLFAIRRNDATDSPTSTVNLGPLPRTETRSNLADQDAVDALADRLLSEGRTFYQVASLRLLPDPRVMMPGLTVDLDLSGKLRILNGRWRVRTASIGFTPDAAGPVLEINRVTDTIRGTLI